MTDTTHISISKSKTALITGLFLPAVCVFFIIGCGETPSSPPEIELGALEIWPMKEDSSLLPEAAVILNDDSSALFQGPVPIIISGLVPKTHNVYVVYGDYQNTSEVDVREGDTTMFQPVLTQFAPDFVMPGFYYDFGTDTLAYVDSVRLSDYRTVRDTLGNIIDSGEVVLLFFFNDG